MAVHPSNADILADPAWLPHRYDAIHDAIRFAYIPRELHRTATFLTDEYLQPSPATAAIARAEAVAGVRPAAPVHFIFHSAFCGSTMLARALDIEGVAMGLKEPPILNDLVGWRHRGANGAEVARVLDTALTLLARPFETGEASVVKPSNVVAGLMDAMIAMRPEARAVLLYAPLPIYLRSIVKKGIDGRLWVRDLLAKLLRERLIDLGLEGEDYLRLTDLQSAAVGWLAQHALFARLAAKYPDRVRTLDSETLMTRPHDVIAALGSFYRLALDADRVASSPAFTQHSKHGAQFDAAARTAEYDAATAAHGDELMKVEVWAAALAKAANMGAGLPGTPLCP